METILDRIVQLIGDEMFLKADGFDEAVIGLDENGVRLIYSYKIVIDILMRDMNRDDADEYFRFNMQSAYVGEKTPIWCIDDY
tara:strand:+ start:89 stop:337 length:249 start_codon:yes stop_codon:yes gene_type:complete